MFGTLIPRRHRAADFSKPHHFSRSPSARGALGPRRSRAPEAATRCWMLGGLCVAGLAPFLVAAAGAQAEPPGVFVAHSPAVTQVYLGSPSLALLPDGDYVASHDLFGPGSTHDTTRVYVSTNRGATWERRAELKGAFWSSLFVHRGALYLFGTSRQDGDCVIRRSTNGGRTWTEPRDAQSGLLLSDARYHCAPVPVLVHGGRLWRAMEDVMGPGGWGSNFRSFMMSVPEDAELLDRASWTISSRLGRDAAWLGGNFGGWLEGNAVATPAGHVVNLLRVDYRAGPEQAAIIEIGEDGRTASFDPQRGFVEFPGGCKKFTVRADPRGGGYWGLANYVPDSQRGGNPERTRNTLALLHSADLRRWAVRRVLLHHPDRDRHGFQYPDWQFDGPDLVAVVRTAFDDATGGAHNQHDANYLTFHRWRDFREVPPDTQVPSAAVAAQSASAAPNRPPNIVFVLTDDLGINDLGCYGRADHRTPQLDQLAREGMRFTSAYCAQPICSPSRAAILTGKHPARLHLTTYLPGRPDCSAQPLLHPLIRQQLPLEEQTLAEYLKAAGYATACIGKWHLGGAGFSPADQGFDFVHVGKANTQPSEIEGGKGEYDLTTEAEKFIEWNRDRLFFLYLAHNTPHIPYAAQADMIAAQGGAFEPVYAAVIESLDRTVGRLLQKLDDLGLRQQTLVIFTSDNGGLHVPEGAHARITHNTPFRAGKGHLYEGGLRIPLIVRWPARVPAGRVIDTPVVNTDWLPTLLELADQKVPNDLDGLSLARLLADQSAPETRRFFWHFPHYTNQGGRPAGALREGDWKLIEHYEDGRLELFNLAEDRAETRNRAVDEAPRAARMRRELEAWRQAAAVQTNRSNASYDAARHRAIYVDFDSSSFDPRQADAAAWQSIAAWRQRMNAAVRDQPLSIK